MIYFNIKTSEGTETIDELDPKDFSTRKEFRKEVQRMTQEYRSYGSPVYTSSRSTKEWRNS